MVDKRCGTCELYEFIGHTGICTWKPENKLVPTAFRLGNMWVTDGTKCPTWIPKKSS